jgi:hypothetical protein
VLYAGGGGVFKSTDGGGIWSQANAGLISGYISAFAVDPATSTTLYAGGEGMYKSVNSGADWSKVYTPGVNKSVRAVASFS